MKRPVVWLTFAYALLILLIQPQVRNANTFPESAPALKAKELFRKYASSLTASLLEAMVLGDKKHIPPQVYSSMMKTGTVHILVVSGFNVGIVAFIIVLLLKMFRVRRIRRIYITIVVLIFYCFLTGASTPVLRATVMGIVFSGAYLFKREPDIGNSLGLAALFILIFNPNQLFNIGFQLSFASVAAIAFLYPRLVKAFGAGELKSAPFRLPVAGFLVSLSAWLATAPIIAWHFRTFSPVTVLANLCIVPLATLITLCGFALLGFGLLLPALAPAFAAAAEIMVITLVGLNQALIKLPFSCLKL